MLTSQSIVSCINLPADSNVWGELKALISRVIYSSAAATSCNAVEEALLFIAISQP